MLIEYLAGVATVVVLNRLHEEIIWRRSDSMIEHWPPYDRQNIVTYRQSKDSRAPERVKM